MHIALVQVCVDERLNHEQLRIQVRHKLAEQYIQAQRVLILNEIGGNLGNNFANALELFLKSGDRIVFAAALHHDDCKAAQAGFRQPLNETVAKMEALLTKNGVTCTVTSGHIHTNNNYIVWQQIHQSSATS